MPPDSIKKNLNLQNFTVWHGKNDIDSCIFFSQTNKYKKFLMLDNHLW